MGCQSSVDRKDSKMTQNNLLVKLARISSQITKSNQVHLIQNLNLLQDQELSNYYQTLQTINFDSMNDMFQKYSNGQYNQKYESNLFSPISQILSLQDRTQELEHNYQEIGLKRISEGQVGIIIMAAGQGSRLKFDKPKGMYNPGLPSQQTLFHIYMAKIISLSRMVNDQFNTKHSIHKPTIPLFIMTSPENDSIIKEQFKKNCYYGLPEEWFTFFAQDNIPAFDNDGKMVLSAENIIDEKNGNDGHKVHNLTPDNKNLNTRHRVQVLMSPNGNGGVYDAIKHANIHEKCEQMGVKYLQIMNIDNILSKMADPFMIGYMEERDIQVAVKALQKRNGNERVGVLVNYDGKSRVIEYSDMSTEMKNELDSTGTNLKYSMGYSGSFFFRTDFLTDIFKPENDDVWRKYHVAQKSCQLVHPITGAIITPEENTNNILKFELFIFDTFPLSKSLGIVEIDREEEFAPIQNHQADSKDDNPVTARRLLYNLHRKWIESHGVQFVENPQAEEHVCQVDASLSYDGEHIIHAIKQEISNPENATFPVYLI